MDGFSDGRTSRVVFFQKGKHEANVGSESEHLHSHATLYKEDDEREQQEVDPTKDRSCASR